MKSPEEHEISPFSDETMKSLIELGEILRPTYEQMISEGHIVKPPSEEGRRSKQI